MKKILAALLLSAAILAGCGTAGVTVKADLPDTTPAMTVRPANTIRYQVDLEPFEQLSYAEDGQLLAEYHVQVPVMRIYLEDGTEVTEASTSPEQKALAAAETFNERFSIWLEEESFQELADNAREDLNYKKENGLLPMTNHALDLSCTVYQTDKLISVAGLCYSFTGGAHPNTWQMGWNFDLEQGNFFGGEVVSADSTNFREAVSAELRRQAAQTAEENGLTPEEMYWPEYETILDDWGSYTVYFDRNGMHVVFSPYELAPHAAGAQEFHFPYSWLQSRISERGCAVLGLECRKTENEK